MTTRTSHIQRSALDDLIHRHTGANHGNVFVDVRLIKKIAIEFSSTNKQEKPCKNLQRQLFNAGYRKGYTDRSDIEYNEAISANWQEAFEVKNEIPTNITIIEPSDDDNLLDYCNPDC